ncbi:TetR/AcrR family transcriptional regulator [Eubacterium ruminantium]|uniref:TetR/AcrR family transcriptional regulator n=1 Tax=Eubacterium ruminantium TaxID=42322 RepID=UPI0015695C57|nr:TetR/AcrR family transcriptional regulator [Eubacterium ruminantium]
MNRKEEILHATLTLAAENGMKGVSMSQIADKVGIKAPSLYNHFKSKDDIIKEMYLFFREQAQKGSGSVQLDMSKLMNKNIEEILLGSVSSYMGIVTDKNMLQFFKVLYSERTTNPVAAQIIVEETERMINTSKNMFYAFVVHGKAKKDNIDVAAMTYSLTIHSLIDYRMDMLTAGIINEFGEDGNPVPKNIIDFIRWFSHQIGVYDE